MTAALTHDVVDPSTEELVTTVELATVEEAANFSAPAETGAPGISVSQGTRST